ncbi:HD-GYP domain-containing protein, partial [Vibrio sp. ER1A]|uniref:HD-GYP domain-containing protein n=1 Tax=Vibrio sp. ER1A TaxID=1517681 RepID=UPI0004DD4013
HHEKWDGSGYPKGTKGEDIPLSARIVTIADVFDALTSSRSYKDAWSVDEALSYLIQQSGIHFDRMLVNLFVKQKKHILHIKSCFPE